MYRLVHKRAAVLVPVMAVVLAYAPRALPQVEPLLLNALIQEGDLILEEAAALAPVHDKLAKEGEQMALEDKALRAEVEAMQGAIKQFNAAMEELNTAAKKHQEDCPQKIEDPALVASCNARVVELTAQARKLDEARPQIEARRQEMNARVDKHNTTSQDFARRKQEGDSRDMLNQRDAEEWLGRARQFLASDTFNALPVSTGSVSACTQSRIAELATLPSTQAVKQAQACLRAVKASVR